MNKFSFLRAFKSPFKRPKIVFGFSKGMNWGTPYFYPRRWIKPTHEIARDAAQEEIDRIQQWNELNKKNCEPRRIPNFDDVYQDKLKCSFPVPKKIGFDFVSLGWKSKWSDTDYRFEWGPIWSFVFFGFQFVIMFRVPEMSQYWEAWLYYERNTDKSKSQRERIEQCKKEFPLIYTSSYGDGRKETTDYYDLILKDTYK